MTEALHARAETLGTRSCTPDVLIRSHRRRLRIENGRAPAEERDLERERRRGKGRGALLDWSGLQAWQVMHSANWWIATAAVAAIGGRGAGPAARRGRGCGRGRQGRNGRGGVEWRPREGRDARPSEWGVANKERRRTHGPRSPSGQPAHPSNGPLLFHSQQGKTFMMACLEFLLLFGMELATTCPSMVSFHDATSLISLWEWGVPTHTSRLHY